MLNIMHRQRNANPNLEYHLSPIKMAITKTKQILIITSVGNDTETLEPSHMVGGNVKWFGHFGNSLGVQKVRSYHLTQ